jgi:hypothetical protein
MERREMVNRKTLVTMGVLALVLWACCWPL